MSRNNKNHLKVTFQQPGARKLNVYLMMPSPTFPVLKCEIAMSLFEERKQPRCEFRTFWIDEDGDEIDIMNQCDYDVFRGQQGRLHLHVAPMPEESDVLEKEEKQEEETVKDSTDPVNFIIHERVECDNCGLSPIIGFRYKCLQCPNYDLCGRCDAEHKHHEHVMLRLPNDKFPKNLESLLQSGSDRDRRRHHKRSARGFCPYIEITSGAAGIETGATPKVKTTSSSTSHHEHKKHHKHHLRSNILTHIYDIMQDFAEGGTQRTPTVSTATTTKTNVGDGTNPQPTVGNSHIDAHKLAHDDAIKKSAENHAEATKKAAEATKKAAEATKKAAEAFAKFHLAKNVSTATNENIDNSTQTKPNVESKTVEQQTQEQNEVDNEGEKFESNKTATKTSQTTSEAASNDETSKPRSEPTIPILNLAGLENMSQVIDPQYMSYGIEILKNFSDMFAKMLDPADNADGSQATGGCPFVPKTSNGTRKNSTASTSSSKSSNSNEPVVDEATKTNSESEQKNNAETSDENKQDQSVDETVSNAEDNDWQMINQSNVGVSDTDASSSSSTESFIRAEAMNTASSMTMTHQQLSNVLKTHLEDEAKQEAEHAQNNISVAAAAENVAIFTTPTVTRVTASTNTTDDNEPTTAAATATETTVTDEYIYHHDIKIDKAVKAMMAMGFSNEGAWLTQLLESVDGNISNALDIMCVAQRPRNEAQ